MIFEGKSRKVTWNFLRWEIDLNELNIIACRNRVDLNGVDKRGKDAIAREVAKYFNVIPPAKKRTRRKK